MNPEETPQPSPVVPVPEPILAPEPQPAPDTSPHYSAQLDRGAPVELNNEEHVLRVVYRHPINLLPVAISTGIILSLTAVASYSVGRHATSIEKYTTVSAVMAALLIVAALAALTFLIAYFIYRQNRIVLTNQNLMQVEQYGLFNRIISKLSLTNVEDVTGNRKGLLATLLNYGALIVETAGEQENFVFEQAPRPAELVEAINQAHENVVGNRRMNREQRPF